jgi:hypothetical protein
MAKKPYKKRRLFDREHLSSEKDGYKYKTTQQELASRYPEDFGKISSKIFKSKRRKKGSLMIDGVKYKVNKRTGDIKKVTKTGLLGLRRRKENIPSSAGVNRPGVFEDDVTPSNIRESFKARNLTSRNKSIDADKKSILHSAQADLASREGSNIIQNALNRFELYRQDRKKKRKERRKFFNRRSMPDNFKDKEVIKNNTELNLNNNRTKYL